MARLLGPDLSVRLALRYTSARQVQGMPGKTLTITTDVAGATPASIAAYQTGSPGTPGSVIAGSKVVIGQDSKVPLFWFPDGVDTVYGHTRDGHVLKLIADVDARLDAGAGAPTVMVWDGDEYVESPGAVMYVGPTDPGAVPDGSVWIDTTP